MKKLTALMIATAMALPSAANAQNNARGHDSHAKAGVNVAAGKAKSNSGAKAKTKKIRSSNRSQRASYKAFARGDRFSRAKARNYSRISYRNYGRLSAPPRGYVWVRAGGDALLVRLSNNIVSRVVTGLF